MRKIVLPENYLERVPARSAALEWETAEDGTVTLLVKNTGWANRLAQKLFRRPAVTRVELDGIGSFVWPLLDGEKSITAIGKEVETAFGEDAQPLYERLAQYFRVLDSYHFIEWK